ncbi:nitric oxide-associated protein 1 [Oncorhynchus keta]|uniref:nitric oxide-associated protein 1 n=1 Tax=Oncorhynchus keta TaxID=8018 RepID=UPI0015FB660E|nr:nitric oxide-associated protein 1 [Oncorhynchus keta]
MIQLYSFVKMYKLLQVPLRELVTCKCSRHLSVPCLSVKHRTKWISSPALPRQYTSVFGGSGFHQAHPFVLNGTWMTRFYSTARGASGETQELGKKFKNQGTHASIEPEKEEEFVFMDYIEPENNHVDQLCGQLHVNAVPMISKEDERLPPRSDSEKQQRTLEQQLRSLKDGTVTKLETVSPDSLIEFHDVGFPLKETSKKKKLKGQQRIYGTPDMEEPVSDTCCNGCGAVMHCIAPDVAGYLPSEKYKLLLEEDELKKAICQRCYLLTHHQKALTVTMSKEEYRDIVRGVKSEKALVLLIVDLLDIPDSIVPDLLELVGENKHIVVLGNKVDLLPGDSENYLQRIKRQLSMYCADVGISSDNIKDTHLISAKTGYGIENLISSLQRSWKYKGDVYLVGTANAGKSTLFNSLLESDYCKSRASDVIHKATISPWPGTTLNLLKFPIINPTPYRMFRRSERLQSSSKQTESDLSPQELKRLEQFSKQGYLVGRIGRTFRTNVESNRGLIEFDPDSLAYGEDVIDKEERDCTLSNPSPEVELTLNELKDAHWLYDTPGIMKEHDVLDLLTEQEVKLVVPTQAIVPRTFVLKPGMSLFLGALGRIDYLQGEKSCWFSVIASNRVPIHITSLDKADSIYQKHAGQILLGVPMGGEERMKEFPPLVSQDFELKGQGYQKASADIKFSSAGWVAVTGVEGNSLLLRAHAPVGAGLSLRSPPLLPNIVNLKGERIKKSVAYKTRKPQALVDTSLSYKGAERLKVKKKR